MDKRQKQVFRLVTLPPAFPAVASGTRGEQVLRLTAAGPLPDLTGFPMKLVAAIGLVGLVLHRRVVAEYAFFGTAWRPFLKRSLAPPLPNRPAALGSLGDPGVSDGLLLDGGRGVRPGGAGPAGSPPGGI